MNRMPFLREFARCATQALAVAQHRIDSRRARREQPGGPVAMPFAVLPVARREP